MSNPSDYAPAQTNETPTKSHATSTSKIQENRHSPNKRPRTPDTIRTTKRPRRSAPATPESLLSDPDLPNASDEDISTFRSGSKPKWFTNPTPIPRKTEGLRKPTGPSATGVSSFVNAVDLLHTYDRIAQDQVRILALKPGAREHDLNGSFVVLNDCQLGTAAYQYVALSYNWGDGKVEDNIIIQNRKSAPIVSLKGALEDAKSVVVSAPLTSWRGALEKVMSAKGLGAKRLLITPNLSDALKHLREENETLYIWIDALCINQNDEIEKKEQVMKLARIYRNAYNVCIWLGSDSPGSSVSDHAMSFIRHAIDPTMHGALLADPVWLPKWANLFDLLRWSWFSRRWVIQELALAKNATVHCGAHTVHWSDFQDAIAIFCRDFDSLKPGLKEQLKRRGQTLAPGFEISRLGANLLVETTSTLFRRGRDGTYESTRGLESLVCSLPNFDTSDPRDTINAFINIAKELNTCKDITTSNQLHQPPEPDFTKDLFQIYRDFVQWVVKTSKSLDILCRHWALPERTTKMPTTPRLVELPSWMQLVDNSAFGRGAEVFHGRNAGDSFVGKPGDHYYYASGHGYQHKYPEVYFPLDEPDIQAPHSSLGSPTVLSNTVRDMSMLVTGVCFGTVSFRNQLYNGVIPKECLEKLGWKFDWHAEKVGDVPDQLWQTLVADRGPNGTHVPHTYRRACQHCLVNLTRNGHINIDTLLGESENSGYTRDYLERVKAATWERSFIEGCPPGLRTSINEYAPQDKLVGLGPPKTKEGDLIVILYGCSVPVILRPVYRERMVEQKYQFIGEAYIYGKMDGEALDYGYDEQKFKLV
jgi:hypothetical protein